MLIRAKKLCMYHPSNAAMTAYGHSWRLWLLALAGKCLRIQFHVDGVPFGAEFNWALYEARFGKTETAESAN